MGDSEDDSDRGSRLGIVSRRRAIAMGGGLAGATLVGGVGLRAIDRAAASAEVRFEATDVRITTTDGSIDDVVIEPSGTVTWANLDEIPTHASFEIVVDGGSGTGEKGERIVYGESIPDDKREGSASNEFSLGSASLLEDDTYEGPGNSGGTAPFDESYFRASDDGGTRRRTISLALTVSLFETEPSPGKESSLIRASDETDFTVTVTNARATLEYTIDANTAVESDAAVNESESA